jgi:hypothetical protein
MKNMFLLMLAITFVSVSACTWPRTNSEAPATEDVETTTTEPTTESVDSLYQDGGSVDTATAAQ